MSTFKECLEQDLSTFINMDEFADEHELNGVVTPCVVQSPTDRDIFHQQRDLQGYDGIYGKQTIVHVKKSDLPELPPEQQVFRLDDETYMVSEVIEEMGMVTIVLHGNMRGGY